jgi:hypothetical protein
MNIIIIFFSLKWFFIYLRYDEFILNDIIRFVFLKKTILNKSVKIPFKQRNISKIWNEKKKYQKINNIDEINSISLEF